MRFEEVRIKECDEWEAKWQVKYLIRIRLSSTGAFRFPNRQASARPANFLTFLLSYFLTSLLPFHIPHSDPPINYPTQITSYTYSLH